MLSAAIAVGGLAIAVFAYMLQRSANLPSIELQSDLVESSGESYVHKVKFRVNPPGQPPRAVTAVHIREPEGARIAATPDGPDWGCQVLFEPPTPLGTFHCRTGPPGPLTLSLHFKTCPRTGRWPKALLSASVEVTDWFGEAEESTEYH